MYLIQLRVIYVIGEQSDMFFIPFDFVPVY